MKKTSFFGPVLLVFSVLIILMFTAACGDDNPSVTDEPAQAETAAEETETADEPLPKPEEKQASDYTCDDFEELKTTLEEDKKTLLLESNKLSTMRDPMAQRRQKFKIEKLSRSITKMEEQVALLTAECQ